MNRAGIACGVLLPRRRRALESKEWPSVGRNQRPPIPVRLPRDVEVGMDAAIAGSEHRRRAGPWTRNGFIAAAVAEKLAKMLRSNRSGGGRSRSKRARAATVRGDGEGV
jgi:hypothetical protein